MNCTENSKSLQQPCCEIPPANKNEMSYPMTMTVYVCISMFSWIMSVHITHIHIVFWECTPGFQNPQLTATQSDLLHWLTE